MSVGLILDETPERCKDCPLVQVNPEEDGGFRYCFNGEWCKLYDHKPRPDWCPLQEVEPVRHGIWYDKKASFGDYFYKVCSVCGEERYMESLYPDEAGYYYCPNCGAKMDGGAE